MNQTSDKPRMIVIGGGFAGLNFLKKLDTTQWDIVLIDRNNYHSFPPLFYQVASSGLDPGSISFPLRREMRRRHMKGVRYHMGEVKCIDTTKHQVHTQYETLNYDKLIIAAGSTNNYFNIPDLEKHVYTIKSTAEAIRCRNDILDRLERATLERDPATRRRMLTFTIIGGGPAGVEIAGALGEMKRYILKREYPSIDPDEVNVILLEGSDKLLRAMSEQSSAHALEYMGHLMVEVRLNTAVQTYENGVVHIADGSEIISDTVIWTAGITGIPFEWIGKQPDKAPGGRIPVDEFNHVQGIDDVYALGDICYHADETWPRGCPQLAQVAIQQGRRLAKNLNKPHKKKPFKYNDKGTMATVGRNRAVADIGKMHFYGRPAWFTWMFVHLISLLGMRNKLTVLITWTWSYFTYSSSLRLLIHPTRYPKRTRWGE